MTCSQRSMLPAVALTFILAMLAPAWASSYKVIYTFTGGLDGGMPGGANLLFDSAESLYGATSAGGTYDRGTVFKLTPNPDGSWSESVLHSFIPDNADGMWPGSGLIFDKAGNLYGTTAGGGAGGGTVYQLTPNPDGSWTETVLYSFKSGSDGGGPYGTLLFDDAGNLYGTTWGEYPSTDFGTVFELSPGPGGSWTEKVLYAFTGGSDGGSPYAALAMDASGKLYSTTQWGGTGGCTGALPGCGTVFSLTPNADESWTEAVLHSFTGGHDGENPISTIAFDPQGRMFATTQYGGTYYGGTVFQMAPRKNGRWRGRVIHEFTQVDDGAWPAVGPTLDSTGNLYGTTEGGGTYGYGTVYKLTRGANGRYSETVLYRFSGGDDGDSPESPLLIDSAGSLYGTTVIGGAYKSGVVFEITP